MGFALWLRDGLAWAKGTHEYRPMGAAVISETGRFRARDFHRDWEAPSVHQPSFVGFFASIGHLNQHLEERVRRPRAGKRKRRPVALPDV